MSVKLTALLKSPWVFHLSTGSCNNCDLEVLDCLTPRFDVERFGMLLVGSIKHADVLLVTGSANRKSMERVKRVYEQMPKPCLVVAIGECGLDYYRLGENTKDIQAKAFIKQIELAKELNIPLMIHCRGGSPSKPGRSRGFSDLIQILKDNQGLLKNDFPGVNHFFTGTKEDAKELLELGFYFTFGGVITFTRDYDEIIKYIGLDRIMVETDAPYVAPEPHRGKRNEPAFVKYTAQKLAQILDKDFEEIAEKTVTNTRKVFGI